MDNHGLLTIKHSNSNPFSGLHFFFNEMQCQMTKVMVLIDESMFIKHLQDQSVMC